MYSYKTFGTCSREILFEIEGDTIQSVQFVGGCSGNTQGVSRLVAGMKIDDAIAKLKGIDCAGKGTSCPDQLARALERYKTLYA
ncbi:MAG: TIGR03905 family TSCPD domain-containing protein [Lachnospiraceae bacterium]|nr:TIGR03905 family TSCPD domain-containing protein [Lachnospiraceae bacterium]